MSLHAAGKNVVNGFAGTERNCTDEDGFAALCSSVSAIESGGNLVDPLFFFGAVGEDELEGASGSFGWRFPGG